MNGIEKIVEHIRAASEKECGEIARKAAEDCQRVQDDYSRREQEEYWKVVNAGSKDAEQRHEQLSNLAAIEAEKQKTAMKQEMLDAAFALAAKKLLEIPEDKFAELLKKHGVPAGSSADALVSQFKEKLSPKAMGLLFD